MDIETKLIYLHRKLVNYLYSGKKIRYWWYNRKYKKLLKEESKI